MNYITDKINQSIEVVKAISNDRHEVSQLLRVKIEFYLLLILGYLWNRNFRNLNDEESRQYIISKIVRPSLGSLVDICRKLDIGNEVFSDRKLIPNFFDYTELRNEKLGHGFLFQDKMDEYVLDLEKLISIIEKSKIDLFSKDFDFVLVKNVDSQNYRGISYKGSSQSVKPWLSDRKSGEFEINGLYITFDFSSYHKVSPFIYCFGNNEFYIYRAVEEKLNGRIELNCIDKTKIEKVIWEEFPSFWEVSDGKKKITGNGTIINIFKNNFSYYIKIGSTKRKIEHFLNNKSSVVATIWGHGGLGKTATIQSVCQDLAISETRKFDYVLFLSAKDRLYNYNKGEIEDVDDSFDNYESLIKKMNSMIFDEEKIDESGITSFKSRTLIIIDDFETFSTSDQQRIAEFIDLLDINFHKVIITTRISNLKIGTEIKTDELNENETKTFALELIKNHFPSVDVISKEKELDKGKNCKSLFSITSGRPLFIFQFVVHWMKSGSINDSISLDIKSGKNAIDFLYGRIYQSLDKVGKDIFDAISVLVNENDLSNLIDKLKYILNKEKDEEKFNIAIEQLNDLLIIKLENDFFTVHSKEIVEIMTKSFHNRSDLFVRSIKDRLNQVGRSKEMNTDVALLKTADSYRTSRTETEVESIYRQILNRSTKKLDIQLRAVLNLSDYWFNYRGNKEKAIAILEENEMKFLDQPRFIKMLSNYYWAFNLKNRANQILTAYFELKPPFGVEINLELLGLTVIYKSIAIIEEREQLKLMKNFSQISEEKYLAEHSKQRDSLNDIYNFYGFRLLEIAKKLNIEDLKPGTRQNIATGLYQLVDVCCRISKYDEAIQISDFGLFSLPPNFNLQFRNAKKRTLKYRNNPS